MVSGVGHLAQFVLMVGIAGAALQQVGQAENGVHRRADFMAHIGQKGAFRLGSGFGLGGAALQFIIQQLDLFGAFADPVFQFVLIAFQLLQLLASPHHDD